jgi:site-specific recombinase XerD
MGQLQDRMIEDLTLRGNAPGTTSAYMRYARALVAFHRRAPIEPGEEHVRAWLLHRIKVQRRLPRTVNVHIAALRVLFTVTLHRSEVMANIRQVRPPHRQPTIPSGQQIRALLDAAPSLKHRAMFMLLYGAGLRVSEMLALTTADIDSARMVLQLRDTKNRHDRIVPLPPPALDALRAYWKEDCPRGPMLFPGRGGRETLTREAVQQVSRARRARRGFRIGSIPTCCATPSPRTCWSSGATFAPCRSCSGIGRCRAPRATPTSRRRASRACGAMLEVLDTEEGKRLG